MNESKQPVYQIDDVLNISQEIFSICKQNNYDLESFMYALLFCVEALQLSYTIPQQELAEIKRKCRKYLKENKE
jgi:5-bromo-4-chloroindolyl phosphate hydrolysis protein